MTEVVTSTSRISSDIIRATVPADAGKAVAVAGGASQSETVSQRSDIPETVLAVSEAELNKQVSEKVDQLNLLAKDRNLTVEFSIDESTNRQVVRIIDKETNEVRMQLPSEAALTVSKNLDALRGVFLDDFV
jgi:flagellar protein FlaG